jgi:hypothetical protein
MVPSDPWTLPLCCIVERSLKITAMLASGSFMVHAMQRDDVGVVKCEEGER